MLFWGGCAPVTGDERLPCSCGKEDGAGGCVRRGSMRQAAEALAAGEASAGALCLVQDQTSRKIQTNWKECRGWQ